MLLAMLLDISEDKKLVRTMAEKLIKSYFPRGLRNAILMFLPLDRKLLINSGVICSPWRPFSVTSIPQKEAKRCKKDPRVTKFLKQAMGMEISKVIHWLSSLMSNSSKDEVDK